MEDEGCLCFQCAALGDCPKADCDIKRCDYFLKSHIGIQSLAKTLSIPVRAVKRAPIENNHRVQLALSRHEYIIIADTADSGKRYMTLKVHYPDRVWEVDLEKLRQGKTRKNEQMPFHRQGGDRPCYD